MKSSKNTKHCMGGCSIYLWSAMVACTLILLLLGLRNSFGAEEMSVEIPITVFHSKVTSIHPPSLRSTRIASGQTEELVSLRKKLRIQVEYGDLISVQLSFECLSATSIVSSERQRCLHLLILPLSTASLPATHPPFHQMVASRPMTLLQQS